MSDNLIRCVHENGKVCFLTKAATENRNFMKKYGIRVEHVAKKEVPSLNITIDTAEVKKVIDEAIKGPDPEIDTPNTQAIDEGIDQLLADAIAEATKPAKPKAARKPRTPKKPTKK